MPSAFICPISFSGYSLACSMSRATGRTSRSTNSATVSTTDRSSADRPLIRTPLPEARPLRSVQMVMRCPVPTAGPEGKPMRSGTTGREPYFDELSVGQQFGAPAITLTSGLAAAHQAITGDRLALALDHELCRAVTGGDPLASPGLVWDIAIGQSTVVTQHVKANLYYRGLAFRRAPRIGDTLRTSTEVVALRQNREREGRAPTGLAALRITTTDQQDRPVLDFWRCAMLPLRDPASQTGHADNLDQVGRDVTAAELTALAQSWQLATLAARAGGPHPADLHTGQSFEVAGGDVVSAAPELARLTLNIAAVHHDAQTGGN